MGKVSALGSRIYLDQYDISGVLNAGQLAINPETPVVTCFADVGPRRIPGNYDHNANVGGFFDAAAGSVGGTARWDEVADALRTGGNIDHYLTQLFGANAAGSVAYDQIVALDSEPHTHRSGQAATLELGFSGRGGLSRGLVLAKATVNAAANGTGQNQGATVAGETYAAIIRVLGGTFSSITIVLQESSDDGAADAYAAIAGLTATFSVANTAAVARVTTTAATEAWKRYAVTAFTGTSATILVTAGRMAVP